MCDDIVDVWDINVSGISEWGEDATPSRFYPSGRLLPWQKRIKEVAKKPVLGVGRFTSPDLMVEAIESGALDIIATCRPSISDPFLPKKIDEGQLEDIRECIGCNICISRWEIGARAHLHSERNRRRGVPTRLAPEKFSQAENSDNDVLVVGSGPAGMECAMVLGKRGMRRVHLVEAQDDMGTLDPAAPGARRVGPRRQLPAHPDRQALERRVHPEYRARRERRQGVRRRDRRRRDGRLLGHERPERLHARHHRRRGRKPALVPDAGADHARGQGGAGGPGGRGRQRRLLHGPVDRREARDGRPPGHAHDASRPHRALHALPLEAPNMHRKLHQLKVEMVTYQIPTAMEQGKLTSAHVFDEEHVTEWDADAVVLVTQRRSNEALFRSLKDDIGLEARGRGDHRALPDRRL